MLTGTGAYLARRRRSAADLSRFLHHARFLADRSRADRRPLSRLPVQFRLSRHDADHPVGARLVDGDARSARSPPAERRHGVRCRADRRPQRVRRHRASSFGPLAPLWSILHVPGLVIQNPNHVVFVAYPLIPWIGVTAAGFGLGQVFDWSPDERRRFLLRAGLAFVTAFVALRMINVYGDPVPWTRQPTAVRRCCPSSTPNKYPPSLDYPADDARAGSAVSPGCRWPHTSLAAVSSRLRQGAPCSISCFTCRSFTCWRSRCAARGTVTCTGCSVAEPESVSSYASARMGIFASDRLSRLDRHRRHAVSALSVVRGRQSPERQPLAELRMSDHGSELFYPIPIRATPKSAAASCTFTRHRPAASTDRTSGWSLPSRPFARRS